MRTKLNLSTRPFTNHRLFWIALIAVYLTSLWLMLWFVSEKSGVIAKADAVKSRIESQKKLADEATADLDRRKKEEVRVVVTEQQAIELASARQLIQRKVFSWNKMISDMEEYVPKNARIISIKVDESATTADDAMARIQVKAIGTTPSEMTEMMINLEKSDGLFAVGETGQEATTENGETPFTLNLTYWPRRGNSQ
jgi:Tfp pilus assembly protein PilN